eukprot:631076-Amphidinium_carterae.1
MEDFQKEHLAYKASEGKQHPLPESFETAWKSIWDRRDSLNKVLWVKLVASRNGLTYMNDTPKDILALEQGLSSNSLPCLFGLVASPCRASMQAQYHTV